MYSRCLLLSLPAAPLTFAPHNKRAPLNALYGVKVGVLESCHLIGSEDFDIPQSPVPEIISVCFSSHLMSLNSTTSLVFYSCALSIYRHINYSFN